jgi:putative intracellular protease/amidase
MTIPSEQPIKKEIIYLYVLNTMADWEVGLAIAELNSHRFFAAPNNYRVQTFALSKSPVTTMGGITIVPDGTIEEINLESAVMLILPGAETWMQPEQTAVLNLAQRFIDNKIPVAAICGATVAMANAGMLNRIKHTSNNLEYLTTTYPNYHGAEFYQHENAVTDGNVITAGSSSSVDFAYHILKMLHVLKPDSLKFWYAYFDKHSEKDAYKLFKSL